MAVSLTLLRKALAFDSSLGIVPTMSGFRDRTSSPNITKQKRSLSDEYKSAKCVHVSYLLRNGI
jgi:hypothetical protein